jgi:hypothetical protein
VPSDHVISVAHSTRVHDIDNTRAVELPLEFEIVSPPVHTIFMHLFTVWIMFISGLSSLFGVIQDTPIR